MNPINFENNQWHREAAREIVEVRKVQDEPPMFRIFIRQQAVTGPLPPNNVLIQLAARIAAPLAGDVLFIAHQVVQDVAHRMEQRQQALAQQNQAAGGGQADPVAEISEGLGENPNLG